jgi:hypothetical protein
MFSGRDSGLFDFVVERVLEGAPGACQWRSGGDVVGEGGVEFGEGGVDDPRVGLGEEDGDPPALVGQLVALGAGTPKRPTNSTARAQPCIWSVLSAGAVRRAREP